MDDTSNQAGKDPSINMGNSLTSNTGEVTEEGLAREKQWTDAMSDAPEYAGPFEKPELNSETPAEEEAPVRDETIARASGVISALNGPFCELVEDGNIKNIDKFIDTIYYFVPQGDQSPYTQIITQLGIDTPEEVKELEDEKRARKVSEDAYRENVNAPLLRRNTREAAMDSIKGFQLVIRGILKDDPAFTEVRNGAIANGVGPFAYMLKDSKVRDLPTLFSIVADKKREYEQKKTKQSSNPAEEAALEETPEAAPEETTENIPEETTENIPEETPETTPETIPEEGAEKTEEDEKSAEEKAAEKKLKELSGESTLEQTNL